MPDIHTDFVQGLEEFAIASDFTHLRDPEADRCMFTKRGIGPNGGDITPFTRDITAALHTSESQFARTVFEFSVSELGEAPFAELVREIRGAIPDILSITPASKDVEDGEIVVKSRIFQGSLMVTHLLVEHAPRTDIREVLGLR